MFLGLYWLASCTSSQSENQAPNAAPVAAAERPTLAPPPAPAVPPAATSSTAPELIPAITPTTTEDEVPFDPAGISRRYMGRQIARILGPENADFFDRPTREREERPDLLIKELNLKPTDVVADIGAGTGYLTFRIAPLVPQGRVYAVELLPQQILHLAKEVTARRVTNVTPVRGTTESPKLAPKSVDLVLLVDTYHELAHPKEMMVEIARALKPRGRVVVVEYRIEDPAVPGLAVHKMNAQQVKKELFAARIGFREARDVLPRQHLLIFEKLPD